jgi:CcmD family protein
MVVITVIAIIFIGIVVFLFSMERRLNKLEKEINNK